MTEYLREERARAKKRQSIRFMLLFTLACITAVVFTMWVFDTDTPTEDQMEQFHRERDERISR